MRRAASLFLLTGFLLAAAATGVMADDEGGDGREGREGHHDRGDKGRDRDEDRKGDDAKEGRDEKDHEEDDDAEDDDAEDDDRDERRERRKARDQRQAKGDTSAGPTDLPLELAADAAVRQIVQAKPGRLTYLVLVGAGGADIAKDVRLGTVLPDLGGDWAMSGVGAQSCTLGAGDAPELSCTFGDLAPGQLRLLRLTSAVDLPPPWEVRTTADVKAANDGRRANDSATSVVGVLLT